MSFFVGTAPEPYYERAGVIIYRGDCREVMAAMRPGAVDLIASDVAYPVISGGKSRQKGRPSGILAANDGKIFAHNDIMPVEYAGLFFQVLRDPGHCYIFVNNEIKETAMVEFRQAGFRLHNTLYWLKRRMRKDGNVGGHDPNPSRWYMKVVEEILFFRKGKAFPINDPSCSQLFEDPAPRGQERRHKTQKPEGLMRKLIMNSSQPGEVVLDPFLGGGTTLESCARTGRIGIGIEIDEAYCEVAARWMDHYFDHLSRYQQMTLEQAA